MLTCRIISNERNTHETEANVLTLKCLFFVLDSDGTTVLAAASCNETLEQNDVDNDDSSSSSDSNSSSTTSSNLDRDCISTIYSRATSEVRNLKKYCPRMICSSLAAKQCSPPYSFSSKTVPI